MLQLLLAQCCLSCFFLFISLLFYPFESRNSRILQRSCCRFLRRFRYHIRRFVEFISSRQPFFPLRISLPDGLILHIRLIPADPIDLIPRIGQSFHRRERFPRPRRNLRCVQISFEFLGPRRRAVDAAFGGTRCGF